MSVKGRLLYGDDVSAIKKHVVRLTVIGGALIQAVTDVSLIYPWLIHSRSLSVMSLNPVRKLTNKTRLNRRSEVSRKYCPRIHYKTSGNNHLFPDNSNYIGKENCGVSQSDFEYICLCVKKSALLEESKNGQSRRRYLSVDACVAVTLYFLRGARTLGEVVEMFGISPSCADRTLGWTICHMRVSLDSIQSPKIGEVPALGCFLTCGCIDCCTHPRNRVHPGEDQYYRTDKKIHFLTSQIVTDHTGKIIRLVVGKGHNNDQGMLNMSRMVEWLEERQLAPLLADLGYSGPCVIHPIPAEQALHCDVPTVAIVANARQASERVLVENVNSWFKQWKFASHCCHFTPEYQAICFVVCGMLTNITSSPSIHARARILSQIS
jgi:hypothetical protein